MCVHVYVCVCVYANMNARTSLTYWLVDQQMMVDKSGAGCAEDKLYQLMPQSQHTLKRCRREYSYSHLLSLTHSQAHTHTQLSLRFFLLNKNNSMIVEGKRGGGGEESLLL